MQLPYLICGSSRCQYPSSSDAHFPPNFLLGCVESPIVVRDPIMTRSRVASDRSERASTPNYRYLATTRSLRPAHWPRQPGFMIANRQAQRNMMAGNVCGRSDVPDMDGPIPPTASDSRAFGVERNAHGPSSGQGELKGRSAFRQIPDADGPGWIAPVGIGRRGRQPPSVVGVESYAVDRARRAMDQGLLEATAGCVVDLRRTVAPARGG